MHFPRQQKKCELQILDWVVQDRSISKLNKLNKENYYSI